MSSGTNITAIEKSTVAVTPAPTWGTNLNTSLDAIDNHDHTSNKGVRITPSAMNINGTLEYNDNALTEVKQTSFENQGSQPTDLLRALYSFGGELYYRDASGNQVQLTTGGSVNAGGSITNLAAPAAANYVSSSDFFTWQHNSTYSEYAKMAFSTFQLYNYRTDDSGSGVNYFVTVQYTGTGTSGTLTLPNETGTVLTTATSFGGAISIGTSSGNANITLSPHGTGEVDISKVDIAGGEIDAVTIGTNSAVTDLRVDNLRLDANTISSTNTNGDVILDPNGTGTVKTDDIATSTTNGDLSLSANGTGQVKINGDDSSKSFTLPDGRGSNTQVLQTNGSGDTSWTSISALSTVDNIVATSAQNVNGTVSSQTVKFGDTFTVNGTLTINSDLILSNVLAKTTAMTITNASAQTVTGDGGATLTGHHALYN